MDIWSLYGCYGNLPGGGGGPAAGGGGTLDEGGDVTDEVDVTSFVPESAFSSAFCNSKLPQFISYILKCKCKKSFYMQPYWIALKIISLSLLKLLYYMDMW